MADRICTCERSSNYPTNVFCDPTTVRCPFQETVDHPSKYGGADNPYEAIKVVEAWGLGFNLGNAVKYVCRAGKKGDRLEDLKKARWYLDREIKNAEKTK